MAKKNNNQHYRAFIELGKWKVRSILKFVLEDIREKISEEQYIDEVDFTIDEIIKNTNIFLKQEEKQATIELFEYMKDIIFLKFKQCNDEKIEKFFISKLKVILNKYNLGLELVLFLNRIKLSTSFIKSDWGADTIKTLDYIKKTIDLLEDGLWMLLYKRIKFKNKRIKKITFTDETIKISYYAKPLLLDKDLNLILTYTTLKKQTEKSATFLLSKSYGIKLALANISVYAEIPLINIADISVYDYPSVVFNRMPLMINTKGLEIGLEIESDKYSQSGVTYCDIPIEPFNSARKYVYPSSGVEIYFKDEHSEIEKVLIIEREYCFYIRTHFKNIDNLYHNAALDDFLSEDFEFIKGFELGKCIINSVVLKENLGTKNNFIENIILLADSYSIKGKNAYELDVKLSLMQYQFLYIAYCNPKSANIEFVTKDYKTHETSKTGTEKHFRVGHRRRLPNGYKASSEAKTKAKEEGFGFIPEGFTFVQTINKDLVSETPFQINA